MLSGNLLGGHGRYVDPYERQRRRFKAIGSFLEFLEGNVNFFVGIVMVVISSALSQNSWHFFIEIGITFILGIIIGIGTGIRAVKKTKHKK